MLLSEYTYILEDCEADKTDEPPAKRPARDDDKDQINQYISAPPLDFKRGNALQWWQSNCENFPIFAKIARKYLSAPSTSVLSKCLFSGAGELHDDKRSMSHWTKDP